MTGQHDKTVTLVERMLELKRIKQPGKLVLSRISFVAREITDTDAEIDNLFCEPRGFTHEERRAVEGSV